MDKRRLYIAAVLMASAIGASCQMPRETPSATRALQVTVSILPQEYIVRRIGGDYVSINVMVPPGGEPHTYEPKPEQLRALSVSAAYFSIGVEFENYWLDRLSSANPRMRIVDTARGIERMTMVSGGESDHEDDPDHDSLNLDPHIWLSPRLVKVQASVVAEALGELDPAHDGVYQANLSQFEAEIDALDEDLSQTLADLPERTILVLHPSWAYFARDYDLEMIPIEVGGQEPSASELAGLIARARKDQIKFIFAQPEFSARAAKVIAGEIGGHVILIDPLAYDWLDNMRHVAETIHKALAG